MNIEKTVNDTAVVVINVFRGEDREAIRAVVNVNELERDVLIFDLSKTVYISSEFISELVVVYKQCEKKFLISGMSDFVERVFTSMGLLKVFKNIA